MGKKKFNNVVIKDEELMPTTIGTYNNKTRNPIPLILLLIIFIAIVIYLPNIQNYINKMLGKTSSNSTSYNGNSNNNNDVPIDDNNNDDNNVEDKKYSISSQGSVSTNDYALNNITLNGTTLSFDFLNKKSSGFDLSNYYLELYSSDNTFISRVKISSDVVASNSSKSYSYTIPSNATLFTFVPKSLSDYPNVTLNYNDEMQAYLVCKSGNKIYSYLFLDDNLSKITHTYTLSYTGDDSYYSLYQEYQSKANQYNLIEGVTSSVSDNGNSFSYIFNVDLLTADISTISDDNIYKAKTTPKEVKFIEEAKGYTCSQN